MSEWTARRAQRVLGIVCLTLGVLFEPKGVRGGEANGSTDEARAATEVWQGGRSPVWLDREGAPPILVYPPAEDGPSPARLLVLLHGMCGHPENACPWFAGTTTRDRFVACPRADLVCSSGGWIWSGSSQIRNDLVRDFRRRVERAFPERVASGEATLAGFSLGGFVALDVAEHSSGEWPFVMLIGARVAPSPRRLERGGVASVLFASGDWDRVRKPMREGARLVAQGGVRSEFIGLGPVGHRFARDMDGWLGSALGWLEGGT